MTHAALLKAPPALVGKLPSGAAGPRRTLRLMRAIVRKCKTDLALRNLALQLTQHIDQRDPAGEIRVLHAFVRDRIRYVGDISGVETIHTPRQILLQQAGDCDDKALLLATLLETLNHPTRFVAVGYGPAVSHVLVETRLGSRWIPLETTENVPPGWYPDNIRSRVVVHN